MYSQCIYKKLTETLEQAAVHKLETMYDGLKLKKAAPIKIFKIIELKNPKMITASTLPGSLPNKIKFTFLRSNECLKRNKFRTDKKQARIREGTGT